MDRREVRDKTYISKHLAYKTYQFGSFSHVLPALSDSLSWFFFHQKSYTFQRDGDYQAIALDEDYDRENQQVIYLGTVSSFSWN